MQAALIEKLAGITGSRYTSRPYYKTMVDIAGLRCTSRPYRKTMMGISGLRCTSRPYRETKMNISGLLCCKPPSLQGYGGYYRVVLLQAALYARIIAVITRVCSSKPPLQQGYEGRLWLISAVGFIFSDKTPCNFESMFKRKEYGRCRCDKTI